MAIDNQELIYVPEVTPGTTPTDDAGWKTLRPTSDSLEGQTTTVESSQMRGDRHPSGQFITGIEVGGAVSQEVQLNSELDDLIEGLMMEAWALDVLVPGVTDKSFSLEREYVGKSRFALFSGMRVGNMDFTLNRDSGLATVSVGFMGTGKVIANTTAVGAGSVAPASTTRPLNVANDLTGLQVDAATPTWFPRNLSLSINNNLTRQWAIGTLAPSAIGIHQMSISGSLESYVTADTLDWWESNVKTNTPVALTFNLTDGTNTWAFDLPECYLAGTTPGKQGPRSDIVQTLSFSAAHNAAAGYPIRITRS